MSERTSEERKRGTVIQIGSVECKVLLEQLRRDYKKRILVLVEEPKNHRR